jgi:hypothetical protein
VARKDWDALDVPHLVEELESMGRQQRAELRNRLAILLAHLARWEHQPAQRARHGNSWRGSIVEQRGAIAGHVEDSPSLRPYIPDAMSSPWKVARGKASQESGLPLEAPTAATRT